MTTAHPNPQAVAVGVDCALWAHQGTFTGFASLGGVLLGAPAIVPSSPTTDPFYIITGNDRDLYIRSASLGWQRLTAGGTVICVDNPAAVVVSGVLWVACKGIDQALWVASGTVPGSGVPQVGSGSWHSLGGTLVNGPAVATVGGALTFFVVSADGFVYTRTASTGYAQRPWLCIGHPAAATFGTDTHFACQGGDRALWYMSNAGGGWSGETSLGGVLIGGAGVAAGPSGPTFYVEGQDTAVWERTLGKAWSSDGGMVRYGVGAAWIP